MSRRWQPPFAWILAGASTFACGLDVGRDGVGKACTLDGRCASGNHCDETGRCVPGGEPQLATLDASPSDVAHDSGRGTAGATSREAGPPRPGNVPNDLASDAADAPMHGPAPEAGCVITTEFFADDDQDGFGRGDTVRRACTRPAGAWATRNGDCNDASARVFPGQTEYFSSAYSRSGKDSFDYDCSGVEEPEESTPGSAPNCAALPLLGCAGAGFAPTGRRESGTNPICGSAELVQCTGLLACEATSSPAPAKRCR
jgi:hypothetical protein